MAYRRIGMLKLMLMAAVPVLSMLGVTAASANDFYAGKTIRVVVGSAAGGGYDTNARLIARNMARFIPGTPTMIVVNMPGAGGTVAANHLFNAAEKDGTSIGLLNRFVILMKVLGGDQVKFAPEQFSWLGTTESYGVGDNTQLLVIRSALPHRTIEDLRNPSMPLAVGVSGTDVPAVIKEALGLNLRLVAGYRGSDDLELAFTRGEVDAHTSGWNSIKSRHESWLKNNFIRPMIQMGRPDRSPVLPDVPTARELAKTPEDRALIELLELPMVVARPLGAPPGVPADRLEILRSAFDKMVVDAAYIEEGNKVRLELSPRGGAEIAQLIGSIAKVPAAVIERYKKAMDGKLPSGG